MLKRVMPEELKRKFQLQQILPDSSWTKQQIADYEIHKIEAYRVPVPLLKVNCWFCIFPGTKITDPNRLIFSSEIGVTTITIQKMWEMEPSEFFVHVQEAIATEMKEYEKRIQLN